MKKVKLAIVTLMLGIATYGGIQTYEHLTMTDAERLMMENINALTYGEDEDTDDDGGGSTVVCWCSSLSNACTTRGDGQECNGGSQCSAYDGNCRN